MRKRALVVLALVSLLALVAGQTARYWRYFLAFLGDHGWYLQVAARVSHGEVLYRDVAWAYGPLPVHVLAVLFRVVGPDAALATLVNGLLAAGSVLLTYAAVRSLLRPAAALAVTAFAAVAGSYVGGDLIRLHLTAYTQAVSWGMLTSLAALVAALRWHQTRRSRWMATAGILVGLAFLSKLEFGASALGATLAVLASGRAAPRAWASWLAGVGLTLAIGFGWQASASGWTALWRGYTGYDMLARRSFWGSDLGAPRWMASIVCFWLGIAALWLGWRWRRWRFWAWGGAVLSFVLAVVVIVPTLLSLATAAPGAGWDWGAVLGVGLQWLAAVPWGLLTPLLIAAAWVGWRYHAPPPWWGLWAFALLTNLRLALTGYSSGLAIAPALALAAWLWRACHAAQTGTPSPQAAALPRPSLAWTMLAVLTIISLSAQILTPDVATGVKRRWLSTSLGDIAIPESPRAAEVAAILADLERLAPPGTAVFVSGWGAGWYLLTGRANPTPFDVVLDGLGTTGAEAARLQEMLLRDPPAVVIIPVQQWSAAPPESRRHQQLYTSVRSNLALWWDSLHQDYVEEPASEAAAWVVLRRR